MWSGKKVSVIFPTYNEKSSIRKAIEDFFNDSNYIDEIIVVNNNAAAGTSEEVAKTKAREVFERKQGYGYAIRKGFEECTGDIIIVSEPDGSFAGRDVLKLFAYADDCSVVFGTRTLSILIYEGANMGWFLKWGNYCVAKMLEILFNTTSLSDMGCTMMLLHRQALDRIKPDFTVAGSHFGAQLKLLVILHKLKFIEIPVTYRNRIGKSSVTGNKMQAFLVGFSMIKLIIWYRVKSWFKVGAVREN